MRRLAVAGVLAVLAGCHDAYTVKIGNMYSYASPAARAMGAEPGAPVTAPSGGSGAVSVSTASARTPEELDAVSCAVIAWQPGSNQDQCQRDLAAARAQSRAAAP
jgi:hypothetical protein